MFCDLLFALFVVYLFIGRIAHFLCNMHSLCILFNLSLKLTARRERQTQNCISDVRLINADWNQEKLLQFGSSSCTSTRAVWR